MENRRLVNTFCMEHASRTCCDVGDTLRLRKQYEVLRQQTETSEKCLAVMSDAICSHCDPDMVSSHFFAFLTIFRVFCRVPA